MVDLLTEYHKRSDHGRDGCELGATPICNCVELFTEYIGQVRGMLALDLEMAYAEVKAEVLVDHRDSPWLDGLLTGLLEIAVKRVGGPENAARKKK